MNLHEWCEFFVLFSHFFCKFEMITKLKRFLKGPQLTAYILTKGQHLFTRDLRWWTRVLSVSLYPSVPCAELLLQEPGPCQPCQTPEEQPHSPHSYHFLNPLGSDPFGSLAAKRIRVILKSLLPWAKGHRRSRVLLSLSALTCTLGLVMQTAQELGIARMFGDWPSVS